MAQRRGCVTASSLRLRDAPVDGTILRLLPNGSEIEILEERAGWLRVVHAESRGWVSAEYVRPSGDETTAAEPEEAPEGPVLSPSEAAQGFRLDGRVVFGPDGIRFARTFRLGVFSSGETSVGDYVAANREAFPGLSESRLNVMQAVSTNEGNLEAINTWDNAFLTFGCFQWTVGTGTSAGELAALLSRLQRADEAVFSALFGRHGLSVADVASPDSEPARGFLALDGEALRSPQQKERFRSIAWAYRFKLAGADDAVRRVQIAHAAERVDLFYRSDRKAIRGRHVADYVTSEYGVALLLDQHVNRPGHVPDTIGTAVDRFVEARGADDPEHWGDEDEARLLELYIALRNETSMTDAADRAGRTREAVEQGLASAARGSFYI